MALTRLGRNIIILVAVAAIGGGGYGYAKHAGLLDKKPQDQYASQQDSYQAPAPDPTPVQSAAPAPAPVPSQAQQSNFQPNSDTLKSILTNCVVRVSVENPSEPFYNDESGQISGFNVDFARLLFKDSVFTSQTRGCQIRVDMNHEVSEYSQVPKQLLVNGPDGHHTVDIAMDGLTYQDDQPVQGIEYSAPYVTDFGYSLIVGPQSKIHTQAQLNNPDVRIGILKGDPDVKAFVHRQFPSAAVVNVDDSDPHFIDKSVDNGVVDAFIYDYPFAVSSIKGTDLKFAVTKLEGSDIAYKIGVRSSDESLLSYLNTAISHVKNSDAYKALLIKYFVSNQAVTTAAAGGERTYSVQRGDTLGKIAAAQMGSSSAYRKIQARNNLPNPDLIQVGQNLIIPR
jgi:ABC-type amino acid transport substrate-binding protein